MTEKKLAPVAYFDYREDGIYDSRLDEPLAAIEAQNAARLLMGQAGADPSVPYR